MRRVRAIRSRTRVKSHVERLEAIVVILVLYYSPMNANPNSRLFGIVQLISIQYAGFIPGLVLLF